MKIESDNTHVLMFDQPGHLVRDCPTRNAVGDTGGRKPKEGYVCRACGSELHLLEDCLVANQRPAHGERRGGRRGPPKEIGRKSWPLVYLCAPTNIILFSGRVLVLFVEP
jgi:hypothetical protein